jgi:hypothetical protein
VDVQGLARCNFGALIEVVWADVVDGVSHELFIVQGNDGVHDAALMGSVIHGIVKVEFEAKVEPSLVPVSLS